MFATMDYQRTHINGKRPLVIEIEEVHTPFEIIIPNTPETKRTYEICTLLVPNPKSTNEFTFGETHIDLHL